MFTLLREIGKVADRSGIRAYAVGGCVRDVLMGRPTHDLDIVVEGDGVELASRFATIHGLPLPVVYRRFGTAMVRGWGLEIEFATARIESYSPDSRKPMIRRATLLEDLGRRDFTINAIAFGINKGNFGRLIDPFNGEDDIKRRIIRTPLSPDLTFNDDPLRILRAVRFGVELGFMLHRDIKGAIGSLCWRLSQIVSGERIRDELTRMLLLPTPSRGIQLMEEVGLAQEILPELMNTKGLPYEDGFHHKDVYRHTLEVLDGVAREGGSLDLKWAALLHDIGKPLTRKLSPGKGYTFYGHEVLGAQMGKRLLKRLRLSNRQIDRIINFIKHHMRLNLLSQEVSDRAIRRLVRELGPMLDDLFILAEADRTGRVTSDLGWLAKRIEEATKEVAELKPSLNGHEVMELLGIKEGPKVGEVLRALLDAIIDKRIPPTKEAGREFVLTNFAQ
jgi:poly(A) polymerase